jgi:nucleoside-diphosphate-sugar epimerase
MCRFLAAQLSTSHYFNITRARRDFGYEPKISIAEGMRRLAADWNSAGVGGPAFRRERRGETTLNRG